MFPPGRLGAAAQTFVLTDPSFIRYTGLNTIDGLLNGQLWITLDAAQRIVLPVVVLTTIQIALIVRIMRSSMLEALNKGYIVAAKAKGLSEKEVINKHARRNALIPTVTLSGLMVAGMLNGVVITETVFGINGIGKFAADAALALDIGAVLGFTLFSGSMFIIANLIVDVLYAYLDPRIRLG
jgi:peptide/nickel transport system permease protein